MLKREENELITRVSPGTPMGDVMRRYWMPALLSSELPQPDSDPVRVRLLGEDLVAFRDSNGHVALVVLAPRPGSRRTVEPARPLNGAAARSAEHRLRLHVRQHPSPARRQAEFRARLPLHHAVLSAKGGRRGEHARPYRWPHV